jgi:hypothetical protein
VVHEGEGLSIGMSRQRAVRATSSKDACVRHGFAVDLSASGSGTMKSCASAARLFGDTVSRMTALVSDPGFSAVASPARMLCTRSAPIELQVELVFREPGEPEVANAIEVGLWADPARDLEALAP